MAKGKNSVSSLVSSAPRMTAQQSRDEMRYRAQDALRTISQAECYKKDKPLMREVKCIAKEQAKAVGIGKKR